MSFISNSPLLSDNEYLIGFPELFIRNTAVFCATPSKLDFELPNQFWLYTAVSKLLP